MAQPTGIAKALKITQGPLTGASFSDCCAPAALYIDIQAPSQTSCMTPGSLLCCGGEDAVGQQGGREGAELSPACTGSAAPVSACLNSTSSCRDLALEVGSSASLGFVMVVLELSNSSLDQAPQRVGSTRPNIIIHLLGKQPLGLRTWRGLRWHWAGPLWLPTPCLTPATWLHPHARLELISEGARL